MGLLKKIILFFVVFTSCSVAGNAQIGLHHSENDPWITPIQWMVFYGETLPNIEPKEKIAPNFHLSKSNVYDNHFGFFCKVELNLEKSTKLPVRFRLGSLNYVDQLEGK